MKGLDDQEGRARILLVDDSPASLAAYRAALEDQGYDIVTASSGPEALKRVLDEDFAAILLDVFMPGMDGFEVARLVKQRERSRATPIIFLTGASGERDYSGRGYSLGAIDFMRKPVDPNVLRAKVGALVSLFERRERERREREARLAQVRLASERRYRSLAESIPQIVFTARADGEVDYFNRRWTEYTGLAVGESLGLRWLAAVHPEDAPGFLDGWRAALRARKPLQLELRLRGAGARDHGWHLCRAVPELDDRGQLIGWLGTHTDIDDLRRAEEALKRREEQLRDAQKMEAVGKLAGGVAHDFNNLLTTILGRADLLLARTEPGDPDRGKLEEIRRMAERAASLTRQLLAFGRKQVLKPEIVDLNAVVAGLAPMLGSMLGERVEVGLALDPDLARIKADPGQIERVLLNLVLNARDAMSGGGSLTIETRNVAPGASSRDGEIAGPGVRLGIGDTGCGMDRATLERAFDPFFTTKPPGKGSGLGLSTVHGIVKQSGGEVRLDSAPGRGTWVEITFPAVEAEALAAETAEARGAGRWAGAAAGTGPAGEVGAGEGEGSGEGSGEGARRTGAAAAPAAGEASGSDGRGGAGGGGRRTILLVEDEEAVRTLAREVLEEAGYVVLEAENGDRALALVERRDGPIDLLVTDVVMPGLGGVELARLFAERCPDAGVLFMSGYASPDPAREEVGRLPGGFLQKPFAPRDLLASVKEVLGPAPAGEAPPDADAGRDRERERPGPHAPPPVRAPRPPPEAQGAR